MPVTRRAALKTIVAGGVGVITGTGAYGFFYERHDLSVTQTIVPVAGLAPSLSGLRIGLLTDIHRSRWVSHDDVARAVSALTAAHPDLIILGGDYVTWGNRDFVSPAAEALEPL